MIRTWCLAMGASLTLLVATSATAQDRSADVQQPIQARPGGPEGGQKTDQTLDVTKGTRLVLSNNAGEVTVRSWDREQVRVQASHSERERVDIQTADMTLRVRGRATRGPANLIDYQITVPRWMPVNLSGTYLESTIEGTTAEVTVETVHGNVRVVGGSGAIVVRSVEGVITVDKATGKVQATSVNEGIRLSNISGDMTAETTNGDIVIENAQTASLEVLTVNGDVTFNGTMRDTGSYRLTTHSGDIRVGLGGATNATVFIRTFQGDFASDFPIQLPEGQRAREGSKRFNFTLGTGSARIELQSFNGDIILARKAILSPEEARRIRRGQSPAPAPPAPPAPPAAPAPPKPPKPPKAFDVADFAAGLLIEPPEIDVDADFDFEFDWGHDVDEHFDAHDFELAHRDPTPVAVPTPLPALGRLAPLAPAATPRPTPAPRAKRQQ